ncbi:hypothetical protein ABTZ89_25285, partial [Saccharopolyspora sp. NPDC002686]
MFRFLRRRAAEDAAAEPVDVPAEAAARAEAFWQQWDDLLPELAAALGDSEPLRVENLVADMVAAVHLSRAGFMPGWPGGSTPTAAIA